MTENIEKYLEYNYPLIVRTITDNNKKYIEVTIKELPGLAVYSDYDGTVDIDSIVNAKKEWILARLAQGKTIPQPGEYEGE